MRARPPVALGCRANCLQGVVSHSCSETPQATQSQRRASHSRDTDDGEDIICENTNACGPVKTEQSYRHRGSGGTRPQRRAGHGVSALPHTCAIGPKEGVWIPGGKRTCAARARAIPQPLTNALSRAAALSALVPQMRLRWCGRAFVPILRGCIRWNKSCSRPWTHGLPARGRWRLSSAHATCARSKADWTPHCLPLWTICITA